MTASRRASIAAESLRQTALELQALVVGGLREAESILVASHLAEVAAAGSDFGHPDDRDLFVTILISWHGLSRFLRTAGLVVPHLDHANPDSRRELTAEDLFAELGELGTDHDFVSVDIYMSRDDLTAQPLFSGLDFSDRKFVDCSFTGASFGPSLKEANFTRCRFTNCTFIGVDARGAHFPDCKFETVTFDNAKFQSADFVRAIFEKSTVFKGSCNFESASFALSSLRSCRAGQPSSRANFANASFSRSTIVNCTFTNVKFAGATFDHTEFKQEDSGSNRWNRYVDCDFADATFVGVDLSAQTFKNSRLGSALFFRCELTGADAPALSGLPEGAFIRCEGLEGLRAREASADTRSSTPDR